MPGIRMMPRNNLKPALFIPVVILLLLAFLTACSRETPLPSPTQPEPTGETASSSAVPTLEASPTAVPPLALLVAPTGSDPGLAESLREMMDSLAAGSGYRFETRTELTAGEIPPEAGIIALLPPAPAGDLAASAPEALFLAVGYPDLNPADNLEVLTFDMLSEENQGFIAGYTAAVISEDWRIGSVTLSDTEGGAAARRGFNSGGEYFCGLCRSAHPPYYDPNGELLDYPAAVELPSTSTGEDWQAATQVLVDRAVEVVFVQPGAGDEAFYDKLAQAGMKIIGGIDPPPGATSQWVVTIDADPLPAVETALTALFNGASLDGQPSQLSFRNLNPSLLSEGRLTLVEKVLADLFAGYVGSRVE